MPTIPVKLRHERTLYEIAHIIDGIVGIKRPKYKPFCSHGILGLEYGLEVESRGRGYIIYLDRHDSKKLSDSGGLFAIDKFRTKKFIILSDSLSEDTINKIKEELYRKSY